ncbi:hypothetical protein F5Y13DRAFT_200393 [Hypoxylon sp. FL1857]|nr:hypothetical protein F5Y13DRAFT_200393 [Hypoxylon sp. FL1857]
MRRKPRTIIDLPVGVREKIYFTAGLVTGASIVLEPRRQPAVSQSSSTDAQYQVTYNLLQTCSFIYSEVKTLVCAHNKLVISSENVDGGLEFLRKLSPRDCSELRHLFIHLLVREPSFNGENPQSPSAIPNDNQIAAWQAAVRHVLSHVTPQRLKLYLICDVGADNDSFTASVLKPLLDFQGVLGDFELRLDSKRRSRASALARQKVAQVKGLDTYLHSRPLPFLKLPAEIRREILKYTDLVTPNSQVQWNSERGFYVEFLRLCGKAACNPNHHHGCQFRSCDVLRGSVTGSFCRARRSAYSSRCKCWIPPRALFLVNRTMYRDACDVFYSNNRAIVTPSEGLITGICSCVQRLRLDASRFITRQLQPDILHRLHHLEIVFPPFDPALFTRDPSPPYLLDWTFAVDHLKAHANVANLTIVIHMTFANSIKDGSRAFYRESRWRDNDIASVVRTHARFLEPLQALRQMKRLFVYLEWPWHWSGMKYGNGIASKTCKNCRVDEMEKWLERMVMGDDYDSSVVGKATEPTSEWLYTIYRVAANLRPS